jgi:hypothetical protein
MAVLPRPVAGHADTQPLPANAIGAPSTPEAPEVPRRGLAT